MAKDQGQSPTIPEVNQAIHWLVQLYGSVIATPNISEDIQRTCNEKMKLLLELMEHDVKEVRNLKIGLTGSVKLLN